MEYHIEIEEHATQKMIHVYMSGIMSETERINMGRESIRKGKENNIFKYIFDIRAAKLGYPLIGSHKAVLNLPELGVTRDDFIVVIYFHNQEQLEHAKIVVLNRGIHNINFFKNIEDGIEWLSSKG